MRVVTVISGSGAFFVVFADLRIGVYLTGFIAVWAVLDFVLTPDKKADLHRDLGRRFTALAQKIATAPRTSAALAELTAERMAIEADEPPCKRLVDLEARNDECRARGYTHEIVPLSRAQRSLGRYFDFGLGRLERWRDTNDSVQKTATSRSL